MFIPWITSFSVSHLFTFWWKNWQRQFFVPVLSLAGMKLIFFTAASMVLWLGFVIKTVSVRPPAFRLLLGGACTALRLSLFPGDTSWSKRCSAIKTGRGVFSSVVAVGQSLCGHLPALWKVVSDGPCITAPFPPPAPSLPTFSLTKLSLYRPTSFLKFAFHVSYILCCPVEGREWAGTVWCLAAGCVQPSTVLLASLFSSSWVFLAEHNIRWCGISLWSFWVSCPGCILSQLLDRPGPLGEGVGRVGNK